MNNNLLIDQIKNKNKAVFKKCYELYFKELVIYANKYIYDYQVSEDLVQEVFIYLWEHSEKIDVIVSLKSYLYKMTKNKCLNYLKSIKITDTENFIALSNTLEGTIGMFSDSLEHKNSSYLKIIEAVSKMPSKMQVIFKLKFIEEYKYKEIASELNISINTVKTQLKRAKIKISESLVIALILLWNY